MSPKTPQQAQKKRGDMSKERKTNGFMGEPRMANDDLIVTFQALEDPARLPVPEDHASGAVARAQELAVGGEAHLACVPGNRVPREPLLPVLLERIRRVD
jgi:hypothetical protein